MVLFFNCFVCSVALIFTCLDVAQMHLKEASKKLYEENIFPYRRPEIQCVLNNYPDITLTKYNVGSSSSQVTVV